jgi:hypothetical protein
LSLRPNFKELYFDFKEEEEVTRTKEEKIPSSENIFGMADSGQESRDEEDRCFDVGQSGFGCGMGQTK